MLLVEATRRLQVVEQKPRGLELVSIGGHLEQHVRLDQAPAHQIQTELFVLDERLGQIVEIEHQSGLLAVVEQQSGQLKVVVHEREHEQMNELGLVEKVAQVDSRLKLGGVRAFGVMVVKVERVLSELSAHVRVVGLLHVVEKQLTHLELVELDSQIEGRVDLIVGEALVEEVAEALTAARGRVKIECLHVVEARAVVAQVGVVVRCDQKLLDGRDRRTVFGGLCRVCLAIAPACFFAVVGVLGRRRNCVVCYHCRRAI